MTGVPLLFECLYAMPGWFTVVTGVPLLFECLYAMPGGLQ